MVYMDRPAVTTRTVIEAQWSDMPEEVVDEVRDLWIAAELGNDNFYYTWTEEDFMAAEDPDNSDMWYGPFPKLAAWLREQDVEAGCLIHWWW